MAVQAEAADSVWPTMGACLLLQATRLPLEAPRLFSTERGVVLSAYVWKYRRSVAHGCLRPECCGGEMFAIVGSLSVNLREVLVALPRRDYTAVLEHCTHGVEWRAQFPVSRSGECTQDSGYSCVSMEIMLGTRHVRTAKLRLAYPVP